MSVPLALQTNTRQFPFAFPALIVLCEGVRERPESDPLVRRPLDPLFDVCAIDTPRRRRICKITVREGSHGLWLGIQIRQIVGQLHQMGNRR